VDDDTVRLIEIDENLVRNELTPAERALHLAERKRIYESKHPETKAGATGKGRSKVRQVGEANPRFTKETARKTGQSERTIQRDVQRAEACAGVINDVVGTSLDKGDELDALAELPADEQRKLVERAKTGAKVSAKTRVKQIARDSRERGLAAKQLALPEKKCGVIACDDEWDFKVWSRETGMDRHASNHYPTAVGADTAEKMHERTKDRFACAADDCALFMWTTNPHQAIAFDLLRLRGFKYVTSWCWDKQTAGTGYWNWNRHEILLLGIKGKVPCPAPGQQWESLLSIKATEHSAKPEAFLEMIEQYFPNIPKIELNRRGPPRPGWDAWGDEVEQSTAPAPAMPQPPSISGKLAESATPTHVPDSTSESGNGNVHSGPAPAAPTAPAPPEPSAAATVNTTENTSGFPEFLDRRGESAS